MNAPLRPDPFRAFRFRVEIEGTLEAGFQSVSGLESQVQVEPYRQGGENGHEIQLCVGTTYPPLVLQRGLSDVSLWDWHQEVIAGRVRRRTISIVLMDERGDEVWRWIVAEAYPSSWVGGNLDAGASGVATEQVSFVHHGVSRQ